MSEDQNFQQRWGLRGKDDANSSSDESKPCSRDHVLKRHRLVTNFETAENENDAISNDPEKRKSSKPRKKGKENLTIINKKQTKNNPKEKVKKTKNVRGKFKPISLDGLKVFTKSIIDELRVFREETFARMSEEMNVISHVVSFSGHGKKKDDRVDKIGKEPRAKKAVLVKKARKTNGASLKKPIRSDKSKDSSKSCEIIEDEVIVRDKNLGLTVNERTKVNPLNFSQKEPMYNVSSPYSSLPSVSANKSVISIENSTFRNDEMLPQMGYFLGPQMPEQYQNVYQMGFQNTSSYYNNQMRNQTSSMGFSGTVLPGMRSGGFIFANQGMDRE